MTTLDPVRVGILGCGDIAPVYLESLRHFGEVSCVAVADVSQARAAALACSHGVPRAVDPERLCTDPDIELVLNLTPPQEHFQLAHRAVAAGKHVYNEKPLAATPERARQLLVAAHHQGVRVGCAPPPGGVWQTCRSLVDRGVIGRPIGANAVLLERGYEAWHPRPRPYFRPGAGPLLDMGPYAVTALVFLLGAVRRVIGFASTAIPERVAGTGPEQGTRFTIGISDHVIGAMQFTNGAVATITASYAVWPSAIEPVMLFGTEATLPYPPPIASAAPSGCMTLATLVGNAYPFGMVCSASDAPGRSGWPRWRTHCVGVASTARPDYWGCT
jgi:predicted dehydrogenase